MHALGHGTPPSGLGCRAQGRVPQRPALGRPLPIAWPTARRGALPSCPPQQQRQRVGVLARAEDNASGHSFSSELLGPGWSNRARLSDDMLDSLMQLPGTRGMAQLRTRAEALTAWKLALQRGVLPRLQEVEWPQEPFRTKFADALRNMEMPRFTRRYPAVLDTLMKQMLALAYDFEEKLAAAEAAQQQQQQQQQQQKQQQKDKGPSQEEPEAANGSSDQANQQSQQQPDPQAAQQESAAGGGGAEQQGQQGQPQPINEEELQQMMQEMMEQQQQQAQQQEQRQDKNTKQLQIQMQGMDGDAGSPQQPTPEQQALAEQLERIADSIVKQFEAQMSEVMDNLETGEAVFDDLNALLDSSEGFDLSKGIWRRSGWRDLASLRDTLEKLPELRELVRQLGRGGGKGPLRRAPEELEARGFPAGVIRSPLQPEEVRGLTRSGDLSRMLPSEMALLAQGWPRKARRAEGGEAAGAAAAAGAADANRAGSWRAAAGGGGGGGEAAAGPAAPPSVSSGEYDLEEYYLPGAHAARMLHRVRRAERMLLSYDRTGWLEDQPARVTSRLEIRPAAELGPIILCLDTSGSMRGARETIAKALALECLRGANRQRRACYLYAFSGPNEVQELELRVDVDRLDALLAFLSCSFMGGTDVDAPLKLSLERLAQAEWRQADILMVTDGEIPMPEDSIVQAIARAHAEMGLEVHGLLVSNHVTEPMQRLCTDVHVFKSWSAVPGGNDYMY